MKHLERYAATHEFLRRAAFALVLREGPRAVTKRALAHELGVSDSTVRRTLATETCLVAMAAVECQRRGRHAFLRRQRGRAVAVEAIDLLLPAADAVDVELVWLDLRLAVAPARTAPAESVRSEFRLATRGWGYEDDDEPAAEDPVEPTAHPEVRERLVEEDEARRALVVHLLDGRPHLVDAVLALADGLVLSVATGRLTAAAARDILTAHLRHLGLDLDPDPDPGPNRG